jgi:hypothetical protein
MSIHPAASPAAASSVPAPFTVRPAKPAPAPAAATVRMTPLGAGSRRNGDLGARARLMRAFSPLAPVRDSPYPPPRTERDCPDVPGGLPSLHS